MDDLIRGYGAIGLIIVGLFLIGSMAVIDTDVRDSLPPGWDSSSAIAAETTTFRRHYRKYSRTTV